MASRRALLKVAGSLWIVGALVYLVGEALTAAAFPGYSYANNYISDLGIPNVGAFQGRDINSPLHAVMNTAFIVQGVLFLAAAACAVRAIASGPRKTFLSLAVVYAIGISLVGIVHGSQASVADGTAILHVIGAALAIMAGNVAAVVAGFSARHVSKCIAYTTVSIVLSLAGLAGLVMLQLDSGTASFNILPDGVWERIAVYSVTAWQLITGTLVLVHSARSKN